MNLSPSLLFTALEFPKFFSLVILLPLWFYPLIMENPKPWLSVVLALGTCALHRGALPLALGFSAALGLVQFRPGFFENRSRWLLGIALISGLAALYFWGMHDRFHLLDLARVTWQNPQLGIFALLGRQNLPEALRWEIPTSCLLFLVWGIFFWKRHPERRRQLLLPLVLLLPGFFPWGAEEVLGVGERYALLTPVLLLLCALYLSSEPVPAGPWPWPEKILCAILVLGLPLLQGWRLTVSHPQKIDPDFVSYDQVTEELKEFSIPMLIAQKGIVFYYKFKWMREAFPYEPEDHWDKARIWRLLYRIEPEELNAFLSDRCGLNSGLWKPLIAEHYTLLREDCWEAMRAQLRREADSDLYHRAWETWLNPAQKRPAFLYSKHGQEEPSEFPALAPGI